MWALVFIFIVVLVFRAFIRSNNRKNAAVSYPDEIELVYEIEEIDRVVYQRTNSLPKEGLVLVAFVDTETTGLKQHDEIITLGILLVEVSLPKGHLVKVVDNFYGMQEPKVAISKAAAAVHGLTKEALKNKVLDLPRAKAMLEKADVLVAHNAKFDRRMLVKSIPEVAHMPWRCSFRQTRWPNDLPDKKLDTICAYFDVSRPLPHNALTDVQAMADCLFMHTGKTDRSRSYLASCLSKMDF